MQEEATFNPLHFKSIKEQYRTAQKYLSEVEKICRSKTQKNLKKKMAELFVWSKTEKIERDVWDLVKSELRRIGEECVVAPRIHVHTGVATQSLQQLALQRHHRVHRAPGVELSHRERRHAIACAQHGGCRVIHREARADRPRPVALAFHAGSDHVLVPAHR